MCVAVLAMLPHEISAQRAAIGQPNLEGLWTNGTITPLQRPPDFAVKPVLTEAEAADYERHWLEQFRKNFPPEDLQAPDLDYTYMDRMKVVPSRSPRTTIRN